MKKNRLGYCCINLSLANEGIKVNRGMIKKTFDQKGLSYVSELVLKNLIDLEVILNWNVRNNIEVYRMSSDMFPWMTHYSMTDLPDWPNIAKQLKIIGDYIKQNNLRVSFHPSHFNVLGSEKSNVVQNTVKELNFHGQILDEMGLNRSREFHINIHINNTKPDKKTAMSRFIDNLALLSPSVLSRLTLENDDKQSGYLTEDLLYINSKTGIPLVFDNFHHLVSADPVQYIISMIKFKNTWGDITPIMHWSSSRKYREDPTAKNTAHADYIFDPIETYGMIFDVEIEAKAKDLSVLKYRRDFLNYDKIQ